MTESEFWSALERVFGSALGRSLASELYLLGCQGTAVEALAAGVSCDVVWAELIRETGRDELARWVHRQPLERPLKD